MRQPLPPSSSAVSRISAVTLAATLRQERKQAATQEIARAALELFSRDGFDAVSVEAIAAAGGMFTTDLLPLLRLEGRRGLLRHSRGDGAARSEPRRAPRGRPRAVGGGDGVIRGDDQPVRRKRSEAAQPAHEPVAGRAGPPCPLHALHDPRREGARGLVAPPPRHEARERRPAGAHCHVRHGRVSRDRPPPFTGAHRSEVRRASPRGARQSGRRARRRCRAAASASGEAAPSRRRTARKAPRSPRRSRWPPEAPLPPPLPAHPPA